MTEVKEVPFLATVRDGGTSKLITLAKNVVQLYGLKPGDLVEVRVAKMRSAEVEEKGLKEPAAVDRVTLGFLDLMEFYDMQLAFVKNKIMGGLDYGEG